MMAIRFLEWYNRLPEWEKDLPILFMDGRYWTPREIYEEVGRGGVVASMLLRMLKAPQPQEYMRELAKARLLTLIEKYPVDVATLSLEHPVYTAEELKSLIERDIDFGAEMIDNEIKWINYILGWLR